MAKKSRKQQSGGTPATVALTAAGVPFTVHSYDHDPSHPSYGEEAAEAMGVSPDRVFKTLVADVDGTLTVAVVPVAGQLDLKALASAAGGKRAAMADPALTRELADPADVLSPYRAAFFAAAVFAVLGAVIALRVPDADAAATMVATRRRAAVEAEPETVLEAG